MKYQYSKWQAFMCSIVALVFMALSGLALVFGHSSVDNFAALFFSVVALLAIWLCMRMFDVVLIDGESVVQHRLGSAKSLAWDAVTAVQLGDDQTILIGERGTRISVGRSHPAYQPLTQLVLDQLTAFVVRDAGTSFRLSPYWATGFVVAGLAFLVIGASMTQSFGVDFWPVWASIVMGFLFIMVVVTLPKQLVIGTDEIEIVKWRGRQVIRRSEIAETRMVPLAGSSHRVVEIVRTNGLPIRLQLMQPGQFRLWLALTNWKRG